MHVTSIKRKQNKYRGQNKCGKNSTIQVMNAKMKCENNNTPKLSEPSDNVLIPAIVQQSAQENYNIKHHDIFNWSLNDSPVQSTSFFSSPIKPSFNSSSPNQQPATANRKPQTNPQPTMSYRKYKIVAPTATPPSSPPKTPNSPISQLPPRHGLFDMAFLVCAFKAVDQQANLRALHPEVAEDDIMDITEDCEY